MTLAFETFMKQYKMTGSEKADGYSRDAFIGLSANEKAEAFRLLTTELPWSVEWLFFLDSEKATAVTAELEQKWRNDLERNVYELQQSLVNHTGNLTYQEHMIEDYPRYDDDIRHLVVDAVNRTPVNSRTIDFFKRVILTEENRNAVAGASIYFLDAMNVPSNAGSDREYYNLLVNKLCSENASTKLNAISQIENRGLHFAPGS